MGEIERARDVRLGSGRSASPAWRSAGLAIAFKAILLARIEPATGLHPADGRRRPGGLVGGLTGRPGRTLASLVLNRLVALVRRPSAADIADHSARSLFLLVGTGTTLLVASRRAAHDRLADALAEVASLAEEVETRDDRLELDARRLRYGVLGMGHRQRRAVVVGGDLPTSTASTPGRPAPDFGATSRRSIPTTGRPSGPPIQAALDDGRPFTLDFRIMWPDGSVHWTHGVGPGLPRRRRRAHPDDRDRPGHHRASPARSRSATGCSPTSGGPESSATRSST